MDARKELQLLGGIVEVILYDVAEEIGEVYFDLINREGRRLQRIFNFFDPESELSLLNKRRKAKVSRELAFVLAYSLELCRETGGRYDVSRGEEFLARRLGTAARVACNYADISMTRGEARLLHPEARIDLGSIAKGFIVDALIDYIKELGVESGFINARGHMRIFGKRFEVVDIQHARTESERAASLILEEMAISTSGDATKSVIVGRRGFVTATAIAGTLMEAEAIATTVLLLETEETASFLSSKDVKVLAVDERGNEYRYNGFEEVRMRRVMPVE